jgi:NAD(P)H-dependent flavin oxidoreductase YrpB (nitropropane dioxygenase family)
MPGEQGLVAIWDTRDVMRATTMSSSWSQGEDDPMASTFRDLIGIDSPVVAFSHCRDVVAAVTNAGGIGVLGANTFTTEQLELELRWLDENVNGRPYGVDVLTPAPVAQENEEDDLAEIEARLPAEQRAFVDSLINRFHIPPPKTDKVPHPFGEGGLIVSRRSLQERIDIALSHPIKFLVSALGPFDREVIERARQQGVVTGGMVGSVKHAIKHRDAGTDVIIAQGNEAAGHTGEISTLVLVPQVVDAVAPLPVLAAGGIADGRQLAAVMALGAQGAWTGTVWLTTYESDVDEIVIEKLLAADSGQTMRTRSQTGKPVRVLSTPFEAAWNEADAPEPLRPPLQGVLVKRAMAGIYENRVPDLVGSAVGQVVGLVKSRKRAATVVNDMMTELAETMERLEKDLT